MGILQILIVLILGTQATTKAAPQLKDTNGKDWLEKSRKVYCYFKSNQAQREDKKKNDKNLSRIP